MALLVVPTPIGNLDDITLRALRVLREADLVACEDTRRTGRLLKHYGIKARLFTYHERNESSAALKLASRALKEKVALVSDAGTPLVSDPGYRLLRVCIERGVEIEVLPGPSALITALVASGLPQDVVVFLGFPPRRGKDRVRILERIHEQEATFVLFESPHRLLKTLQDLAPKAPIAVCRELTKMYEEVFRGTVEEATEHFASGVRGEIVLVVRGGSRSSVKASDLREMVRQARRYIGEGELPAKAAARVARESGLSRREVYDQLVGREGP